MLRYFSVTNFKAFMGCIEFDMLATRERKAEERLYRCSGKRVLPIAAIFGPNAAGKSTFVNALATLQQSVLDRLQFDQVVPNKLASKHNAQEQETAFVVEFETAPDTIFSYELSSIHEDITYEKLSLILKSRVKVLFERQNQRITNCDPEFAKDLVTPISETPDETSIVKLFTNQIERRIQPFQTILGDVGQWAGDHSLASKAFSWFYKNLRILKSGDKNAIAPLFFDTDDSVKQLLIKAMAFADFNITDIRFEPISPSQVNVSQELKKAAAKQLRTANDGENSILVIGNQREQYLAKLTDTKEVAYKELLFVHQSSTGKEISLSAADESDGTTQYINLLPIFAVLAAQRNSVFIVDELDLSLHPSLTVALIDIFLAIVGEMTEHTENNGGQVIFTTHETTLLESDLLRRDEIWILDRNKNETELTRASDFAQDGIRKGLDLRRRYLRGQLGGIPTVGGNII